MRTGAHYNHVAYKPTPLSLCSIYGHEWETLALGEIVCRECGAVHKTHIWQDMSVGGAVRMTATGPADSIHEIVTCVICGMDKAEFDRNHTSIIQPDELP